MGFAEGFGERRYGVWGGTHRGVLSPDAPRGAFEWRPGPKPLYRWRGAPDLVRRVTQRNRHGSRLAGSGR
jgi:hypothetical protein